MKRYLLLFIGLFVLPVFFLSIASPQVFGYVYTCENVIGQGCSTSGQCDELGGCAGSGTYTCNERGRCDVTSVPLPPSSDGACTINPQDSGLIFPDETEGLACQSDLDCQCMSLSTDFLCFSGTCERQESEFLLPGACQNNPSGIGCDTHADCREFAACDNFFCANGECVEGSTPITEVPQPSPAPPSYSISGRVYIDTNGNRVQDPGEAGYPGATITLSGAKTGTTTSGSSGGFTFSSLAPGSYGVTLGVPQGFAPTTSTSVVVTLSANSSVNFGIREMPTPTPRPPTNTPRPPTRTPTPLPAAPTSGVPTPLPGSPTSTPVPSAPPQQQSTPTPGEPSAPQNVLTPSPILPPCLEWEEHDTDADGKIDERKCIKFATAMGEITTSDPTFFIDSLFNVILGLASGIATLLIIYSGYKILTSRGDPERLQDGKETFTSAVIGILFIIFSIVILEVIGVDVLAIPGFGP